MKEIQFDEDQLADIQAIGAKLFAGEADDPRSWNYRRQLVRPKISWGRILLTVLLWALGALGIYFLLVECSVSPGIALLLSLASALLVLLAFLKRIIICLVRIYQRYAPASVRNKCRFEPSCSQYMILSLQKYGLWRGLRKGRNRLKRCNTEDGGFDDP